MRGLSDGSRHRERLDSQKLIVSVDEGSGLVRRAVLTPANVN